MDSANSVAVGAAGARDDIGFLLFVSHDRGKLPDEPGALAGRADTRLQPPERKP